jgi:hypothetical protein
MKNPGNDWLHENARRACDKSECIGFERTTI